MTTLNDASLFTSGALNATGSKSGSVYQRDVSIPLNATLEDAASLGTLKTDQTQLDAKGQVSRENSNHFFKFTLDGDEIKLNFTNNTDSAGLRVQILNSSGKVIADSSTRASTALQEAYAEANSSGGLDAKAGDYYVKVTFDVTSTRSVPQTYSLALYSGTRFRTAYQTTAKAQTKPSQAVLTDNTMTYSLITAQGYENKTAHAANETAASAVNIGWLFQDKSALSVQSQLTDVCSTQYYAFQLQKGDNLKLAYNNHTNTSDTRVQLCDSTGTKILADSHGNEAQKAAYESLSSSEGLAAKRGNYIVKLSYAPGETKTRQIYDFKIYSGTSYDALYETKAGTESMKQALDNGHLLQKYDFKGSAAANLSMIFNGEETNIMETISQYV